MELKDTSDIQGDGKGHQVFKWLLGILGALYFAYTGYLEYNEKRILYFVTAAIYFFPINNFVWYISNGIRKWIMPSAYFASDATELFKQKVFWNIGPQFFGCVITIVILTWTVELTSPRFSTSSPSQAIAPSAESETPSKLSQDITPTVSQQLPTQEKSSNKNDGSQKLDMVEQEQSSQCQDYKGDDPVVKARLGCK
jgi:hypothetical protein